MDDGAAVRVVVGSGDLLFRVAIPLRISPPVRL